MRLIKYIALLMVAVLLLSVSVSAGNPLYIKGEVIYHQDFALLSDASLSGITKGKAGSTHSSFSCKDGKFVIETFDDGRVYAILPASDWTTDFTVEFDFSFTGDSESNGYLAAILTSSGEEPTNISQIIIRKKGTVDDFQAPSEALRECISSGQTVNVRIPVESGVVKGLTLSANGITEELQRTSLLLIGSGNRGFSVRNADITISEIHIVNGIDYNQKNGYWAEHSYAEDGTTPPDPTETSPIGTETAPETLEHAPLFLLSAIAAISFMAARKLKRKKYN